MGPGSASPPATSDGETARRGRLVLRVGAAIVLLLLLRVVLGDKPWDDEVRQWIAEGRPKGYLAAYAWWASLVNAVLVAGLVAIRRHWLGGSEPPVELGHYAPPEGAEAGRPWFRWLLLAAVAAHVVVAGPRLFHSWWGDEEHTVRQAVVGEWYVVDGVLDHDDIKWRDAFFYYTQGNNPVPLSVAGLASWKIWTALGGDPWRCEAAVRAVPFVLGALSVLLTGLFLRRIGLPTAGVLAAWILVLHPWHLRYATQIRAYPMVLMLVPASLLAAVGVLHRGTWRHWALHGLAQLMFLWVYPGGLWFVATLNAALLVGLFFHHRGSDALRDQITRLVVTGLASGAVWLQLMLPNVIQLRAYLSDDVATRGGWVQETLSYLLSGMPWPDASPAPWHPEMGDLLAAHPLSVHLFIVVALALLALGVGRLAVRGQGVALAAMLLPAPITWAFAELRTIYLYPWYVLFALPCAAMLVAAGLSTLFVWLRERRDFLAATATAGLVFLAWFGWLTAEPRSVLRSRSYEPFRESVEAIRPSLDPRDPANERILTASVHGETDYYDPLAIEMDTVADLEAVMRRARLEHKPLFVTFGRLDLVRQREPELLARLEEGGDFELVALFPAFLDQYDRYVYRYAGGPGGMVSDRGVLGLPDVAAPASR
jgi:hypothetical protein